MTSKTRFVQGPTVLTRRVGNEILVGLPWNEEVQLLSGTGVLVWELLQSPASLGEIVEALGRTFEAPTHTIARDVESLLRELVGRGLVDKSHGHP